MMKIIFVAFVLCFGVGNGNLLRSDEEIAALVATCHWVLYPGADMDAGIEFPLNKLPQLIASPSYKSDRSTVMYVFGWMESRSSLSVETIVHAYISTGAYNVIILDWAVPAGVDYVDAVINQGAISGVVGQFMADALLQELLIRDKFFLIGHSMGGQFVSGMAIASKNANMKLKIMIILDPAGPLEGTFSKLVFGASHATAADADFVLAVHTDAGVYGYATSTGTVDFYPNGGTRIQPGCPLLPIPLSPDDFCSHHRSWYYWAESVALPSIGPPMYAVKGTTWAAFILGLKENNNVVEFGHRCPYTAKGNYFFETNAASPFSRGMAGISYSAPKLITL